MSVALCTTFGGAPRSCDGKRPGAADICPRGLGGQGRLGDGVRRRAEHPDAASRPIISPVSYQYLASISPVSRQYLISISSVCHQYLASISPSKYGLAPPRSTAGCCSIVFLQYLASISPVSRHYLTSILPVGISTLSHHNRTIISSLSRHYLTVRSPISHRVISSQFRHYLACT